MFRSTALSLRVSPLILFQNEMKKKMGNKAPPPGKLRAVAARAYKRLSQAELAALKKRAKMTPNPALDAYNRFQKEYAHRFTHLSNKARNRKVAALWRELKTTGRVTIPAAGTERKKVLRAAVKVPKKSAKRSAKRRVKSTAARSASKRKTAKTAKASKKSRKTTKSKAKATKKNNRKNRRSTGNKKATTKRIRAMVNSQMKFLSAKNRKRVVKVLVKVA